MCNEDSPLLCQSTILVHSILTKPFEQPTQNKTIQETRSGSVEVM